MLSRLKPRASEKMGGLGENKRPHHEELFFCSSPIFSVKRGHLSTCRSFFALPISVINYPRGFHCLNPLLAASVGY